MFYASYILAELRRRKGRTVLTALGLGVGVALVVAVAALTAGLDKAQDRVLAPLTGVGTDMSVTRPLKLSGRGFQGLSQAERDRLRRENGDERLGLRDIAKPGQRFETDNFTTATQLSFPASEASRLARLHGVQAVAAGLTVTAIHVSGRVPKQQQQTGGLGGPPVRAASTSPAAPSRASTRRNPRLPRSPPARSSRAGSSVRDPTARRW